MFSSLSASSSLVIASTQIFDKALFEPHFCELYSQLCHNLQRRLPEFDDPSEEAGGSEGGETKRRKLNFRRLLLNKCQEEFEKGDAAMLAVAQREAKAKERGGDKVRWQTGARGGGAQRPGCRVGAGMQRA
jgi:translation initiation factor 4G